MPAAAVAAAATVASGAMSASASKKAAATQAQAAREDRELQREMFERQVELQAPFREAGLAGTNRLAYLMGLSPTGYGGGSPAGSTASAETAEQIRARLLPQFTTTTQPSASATPWYNAAYTDMADVGATYQPSWTYTQGVVQPQTTVNEAGLSAAITAEQDRQRQAAAAQGQAAQDAASRDPLYGSLMRDFSMADYEADPGYAFRMAEGNKALERSAAARGGLLSGRSMKDILRFSQDLGSQEYGNAYNRFQTNQGNRFNRLASIAGIGQTATNQVQNAAQNYAMGAGNAINQGANARASGYVGRANALSGAIGQGVNLWQQQQMLNSLQQPQSGWNNPSGWGGTSNAGFFYGSGTSGD